MQHQSTYIRFSTIAATLALVLFGSTVQADCQFQLSANTQAWHHQLWELHAQGWVRNRQPQGVTK